jgi:uncharacterized protein
MNRRLFLRAAAGLLATGTATAGYGRFVEPRRVEFTIHRHGFGAAADARPFSFAQISDLHFTHAGSVHEDIARELQRLLPDFIVLTGDSVNGTADLPVLDEFLSLLPRVPLFAILGNWERWGRIDVARFRRMMERRGGRLLVNESVLHGDLLLTGLDDLVGGRPDHAAALRGAPDSAHRLLLAHCPLQRDLLPPTGRPFDLVISGHTHGGQVRPFGWAPIRPRGSGPYVAGWYDGGSPLYVSRGVGTSVLPIRLGARPEIAVFG